MTQSFDVDDEAMREAQEELRRLEAAESFSPPDVPAVQQTYAPAVQPKRGYAIPGGTVTRAATAAPSPEPTIPLHLSADPKTLEDLYALFPVGDGDYKLRIERKAPTHFHGPSGAVRVAGFIMDLDMPISMTEFAARFGGQRYDVSVIGPPSAAQRVDSLGNRVVRLLKKVEVSIPGPPKLTYLPAESREESMVQHPQQFATSHPEVEKARIEAESERVRSEAEERRRYIDEARSVAAEAARTPEKFLVAVREQNERSINEVKSLAQQQVELLRNQNQQLRDDYFKVRDEADKLRTQLVQVQHDADRRARESETEKIAALKADHEREVRRIQEERASQIDKVSQQHRDDLTRLTNSHTEELRRVESAASKERDLLVRDMERREGQSQKDAERERTTMRETYESRLSQLKETLESRIRDIQSQSEREISALKDAKEREIASIKESREREIVSVRSQFEMQASVARDTASLRIENVNAEMQRLRDEIQRQTARADAAERESQDLRAASHKEPAQAIEEAKNIVSLVGWGPKEEGATPSEEGEFDWRKTLAKAGMSLVDKLPEITRDVISSRQQAGAAGGPPGMPPGPPGPMMLPMGAAPPRMLPPPQAAGWPPPQQQPPPQMQRPSFVQAFPSQQPVMQPQRPAPMAPPPAGFAPPWAQQPAPPPAPRPAPMPTAPLPFPTAPSEPQGFSGPDLFAPNPAPAPASAPAQSVDVKPEHFAQFLQELEIAIRGGVVPPGMFARGFIDKVGKQNAVALLGMFTPDALVASVQAQEQGSSTAIVTRDGQRYVQELWAAASQQLAS